MPATARRIKTDRTSTAATGSHLTRSRSPPLKQLISIIESGGEHSAAPPLFARRLNAMKCRILCGALDGERYGGRLKLCSDRSRIVRMQDN
ncbi:hypothetical protein EVAR_52690_1 [Eumeta japonica]|uniref:Uncharacterized protein n=1 Tax=Eumeta variegata TaxID=151549 RepID=A0A4C1Y0L9_EUMVA|nr:hypothetical protein EVAR_52690_1 [Eumeta japonica]